MASVILVFGSSSGRSWTRTSTVWYKVFLKAYLRWFSVAILIAVAGSAISISTQWRMLCSWMLLRSEETIPRPFSTNRCTTSSFGRSGRTLKSTTSGFLRTALILQNSPQHEYCLANNSDSTAEKHVWCTRDRIANCEFFSF
uniref:(northern house mosquito) hypothetical protein n=1 Tax=Culex pipiens TaxID=7175 RepID=A0A8D8H8E1_CULPI